MPAISDDGGITWKPLAGEPPNTRGGRGIALSADGKTIVWTPMRGTPFVSTDRGASWAECAGLSNRVQVVADPVNPFGFYAFDSRENKLLASTNRAIKFDLAGPSLALMPGARAGEERGALLCATPGMEGDLWLAFRDIGLYHAARGGTAFAKVGQIRGADALGFGKAAPEKSFPAVFLAGSIGGRWALFRSDDAGETWVRINDDQHQFGYISHLTGDPRIFGRVYCGTGGRGVIYGDLPESSESK